MNKFEEPITIIIHKGPSTGENLRINSDAFYAACKILTPSELRLWMYLADNQPIETYSFSKHQIENEICMPISTYYKAFRKLIQKGYLTPIDKKAKTYNFSQYIEEVE